MSELRKLPAGAKVQVKLKTGQTIRGRLVSVSTDSFILAVSGRGTQTNQTIPFSDASNISAQRRTHTPVVAWIAAGAIAAVVVIVVSVFLIERHNEGA